MDCRERERGLWIEVAFCYHYYSTRRYFFFPGPRPYILCCLSRIMELGEALMFPLDGLIHGRLRYDMGILAQVRSTL
jgi:hypothetical protein